MNLVPGCIAGKLVIEGKNPSPRQNRSCLPAGGPASTTYIYNRCRSNILLLFDPLDLGRHGGLPLRLANWIRFVLQPPRRIAGDIFTDTVHFGIVTNDPFVIIALPSKFGMAAVMD
jgi:hypothetical protein